MIPIFIGIGYANPNEAQNCSPTIQEFLDFTEDKPDYVFGGYAVIDTRNDYRVSIVSIEHETGIDTMDGLKTFLEFARCADDFEPNGYAWWD